MAIVVEHEKRRYEILEKALDVFVEEGYEDATFQKIADRCGITRTTLYLYFKNKREIFVWSIKQLTEGLEADLREKMGTVSLSPPECLELVMHTIIDRCTENRKLFNIILTYLLQAQKTGKDPDARVKRRTIRLRHILSQILIAGKSAGVFRADLNVKDANELFYCMIESSIYRIAILDRPKAEDAKAAISLAIRGITIST
jgi:AcrR family transcriptional regulator